MGPLSGVRVVEMAGLGPGPFAAMLLADMGAEVVRLTRPDRRPLLDQPAPDTVGRGRVASICIDLKDPNGVERVLALAEGADALIEGMRPGVMERLGLGPEVVMTRCPRLVYGRITGYGQAGPLAQSAGHDINYIAIAGALGAIARTGERPLFPLNLLGDYGGGGVLFAFGLLCGILEAQKSGGGQVIDASMVDGTALLTTPFHGLRAAKSWTDSAGSNVLDSGAHFYEVYETADGRHLAVGAIEPQFYSALLDVIGINPAEMPQWERERWPEFKERLAETLRTQTLGEWETRFESTDACVTPVLTLGDALEHPHNQARGTFPVHDGIRQPAPSPRFSRTPAEFEEARSSRWLDDWLEAAGSSATDATASTTTENSR